MKSKYVFIAAIEYPSRVRKACRVKRRGAKHLYDPIFETKEDCDEYIKERNANEQRL